MVGVFENGSIAWQHTRYGSANYDVFPDGQSFVMVSAVPPPTQITVVLHWTEELKRRVPVE